MLDGTAVWRDGKKGKGKEEGGGEKEVLAVVEKSH